MQYVATKLEQSLFINSIISIHYFEYTPNFRYEGESHDFWELIYCDNGSLSIVAGDRELILKHGEAYIHPPCQFHNVRVHGDRAANSIILSFESDSKELHSVADRVLSTDSYVSTALFSILREARVSFCNPLGKLHEARLIRKNTVEKFASEQIIQNYTELLLIHLIRRTHETEEFPELPPVSNSSLLEDILKYMSENLGSKITFSDLTKRFSVSSTTLKNLFSRTYSHGAMEHLTRMRIDAAKELLRTGRYSCTDIASSCGFCSVHHFSGVFRKYESCSPTEYVGSIKSMLEDSSAMQKK